MPNFPKNVLKNFALILDVFILCISMVGCQFSPAQTQSSPPTGQVLITAALKVDETVWYVAINGDDANACHTAAIACRNITTAMDRAKEGDTIKIGSGQFNENLRVTKSLTFIGAGAGSTILDGQGESTWKSVFWFDGDSHPGSILHGSLSNMTIQNGINASGGWDEIDDGGGIAAVNADLDLSGVQLTNNRSRNGGGIYFTHAFGSSDFRTLTIVNSTIENNEAEYGAGIFSEGILSMQDSTVTKNTVTGSAEYSKGGGIYTGVKAELKKVTISNNVFPNGPGAGIYNGGELLLEDSLLEGNDSEGICNDIKAKILNTTISNSTGTGVDNRGEMFIQNSTISGTHSTTFYDSVEAGLVNWTGSASLTAVNVTIAHSDGAAMIQESLAKAVLHNVLFADNVNSCVYYSIYGDPNSKITGSNNIAQDETCGESFLVVNDAKVGPLQDNGGETWTVALLPGSPAIDAGGDIHGLTLDQRGVTRPLDGNGDGLKVFDVGAFEFDGKYNLVTPDTGNPLIGVQYIPSENQYCRTGPDALYEVVSITQAGTPYSIVGINPNNDWYYIGFEPQVNCWVWGQKGEVVGVLTDIPTRIVAPPTLTPTLLPTNTPIARAACSSFSVDKCPSYCKVKHDPSGLPIACVNK